MWRSTSAADGEVRAASGVHPEASAIDSPCLIPNARRAADLARETDLAISVLAAVVSTAIIGGTVDRLLAVAGLGLSWSGERKEGCEKEDRGQEKICGACHLALLSKCRDSGIRSDER